MKDYVTILTRLSSSSTARAVAGPAARPRTGVLGVIATIRDNNGSMTETAEYLQIPVGLVES
ncbi:MAG: hypothetical protein ACRDOL_44055, partial [Streptosporangiaceae bacterium]